MYTRENKVFYFRTRGLGAHFQIRANLQVSARMLFAPKPLLDVSFVAGTQVSEPRNMAGAEKQRTQK